MRYIAIAFFATVSAFSQSTHHVPGDFGTIQAAVDAALDGDTILVAAGVYTEYIDVPTSVRLVSASGPSQTTIVSPALSGVPGVRLDSVTRPGPSLEGFTLSGADFWGALQARGPASVRHCVFTNNNGGSALIALAQLDVVIVESCTIIGNTGTNGVNRSPPACSGFPLNGTVGGLRNLGPFKTYVVNCMIANNQGGDGGDAIGCGPAGEAGAGGIRSDSGLVLINTTVTGNVPGQPGFTGAPSTGAIEFTGNGPTVINCVIHGNVGPSFLDENILPLFDPPAVEHSNVQGHVGGIGNIDLDPLFVDAANGDYRLSPGSPCIDTGNTALPGLPIQDLTGRPRILGAGVDMGAHEFSPDLFGTADGLELRTTVDAFGSHLDVQYAWAGSDLLAKLSATATLAGTPPVLLGQVFGNPSPPAGIPAVPFWFDTAEVAVFHDGAFQPGPLLGPGTILFGPFPIPAGLAGLTLRLQAFGVTSAAANGAYAASGGQDLVFF